MADEKSCGGGGQLLLAFVIGAAVGGGIALLTAPRSGRETRAKIRETAGDVRDRIRQIAEEAQDRIKAVMAEGEEVWEEKRDTVKAGIEAARTAMAEERAKHAKS